MKIDIKHLIDQGFAEDLRNKGDLTSNFTIDPNQETFFKISNRQELVICGANFITDIFNDFFEKLDIKKKPCLETHHHDGDFLPKNSTIISGNGNIRGILAAERLALNLLQHLSAISTKVYYFNKEIAPNSKTKILDTRKTIPGLRNLQKYAVKIGGGKNHRIGLFDGILIKDNHIAACGSVKNAILQVRENLQKQNLQMPIEIECDNLNQVKEAVLAKADIILLDNMDLEQIKEAQEIIQNSAKIEVSGNVTIDKIRKISELNVDFISIGELTHSVNAVDIGLDF